MAAATFVFYANNLGTATARPVFQTLEGDTLQPILPADLGYGSDVSVGMITADDPMGEFPDDDETTTIGATVDPSSLTAITPTTEVPDLAEQQRAMREELDAQILAYEWTQNTDSKLTVVSRNAFKLWRDKLTGYSDPLSPYYQAVWATDPLATVVEAPPVPSYTSTDIADRMASLMGDQTLVRRLLADTAVSINKMSVADRLTAFPEFTFDDPDPDLFDWVNTTPGVTAGFTTANKSGGWALWFGPDDPTQACSVRGKTINALAVEEGQRLVAYSRFRSHTATTYSHPTSGSLLQFGYRGLDASGADLGAELIAGVGFVDTTWQDFGEGSFDVVSGTGIRYVKPYLLIPANMPAGTKVRVDGFLLGKAISGAWLKYQTLIASLVISPLTIIASLMADDSVLNRAIVSMDAAKLTGIVDAARVAAGSLPLSKLADITPGRVLGRAITAGADGPVGQLTGAQLQAIIGDGYSATGIGAVALLRQNATNVAIVAGTTYAGANLINTGFRQTTGGSARFVGPNAPAGTWLALGDAPAVAGDTSAAIFVRVA